MKKLFPVVVLALLAAFSSPARASDATTLELVMAANAAAVQDGGQKSITSLFNTKFARGLAQGQTVSISLLQGASFEEKLAPNTFLSVFATPPGLIPLETGSFEVWDEFFEEDSDCPETIPKCVAPTELQDVQVRVNGERGFISAVISTADFDQINFISPGIDDIGFGAGMMVEVDGPEISGSASFQFDDIAPGFFPFEPQGRRFLAAVQNTPDPDTPCTFVGPADLFGGRPLPQGCSIRPARPGDIIQLFGTGFGETDPDLPVGRISTVPAELVDQASVEMGGLQATVFFAGLAPNFAGVFQVVIEVPDLADGDHELIATIAGRQTQSGAFINVESE